MDVEQGEGGRGDETIAKQNATKAVNEEREEGRLFFVLERPAIAIFRYRSGTIEGTSAYVVLHEVMPIIF